MRDVLELVNHPYTVQNTMENQDLIPHSEESQESCSNKKAKLELDFIQAPSLRGQADEVKSTLKKSEDKCYKCKKYGHKSSDVIPLRKQGRGAALTARASRSPTGQVDGGGDNIR